MIWILEFFSPRLLDDAIFLLAQYSLLYVIIHTSILAVISSRHLKKIIANAGKTIDKNDWLRIYKQNWRLRLLLTILSALGVFLPLLMIFSLAKISITILDSLAAAGSIDYLLISEWGIVVCYVLIQRIALIFLAWFFYFVFRFILRKRIYNLRLRFPGIKLYGL